MPRSASRAKAPRQANIELLRILAMFFIVACHGILHLNWLLRVDGGGSEMRGLKRAISYVVVQYGQVGVCVFFMITGYFLARKKITWQRVFTPWAYTWIYSVGLLALAALLPASVQQATGVDALFATPGALFHTLQVGLTPIFGVAYWFMTAYIILLLLSPFLNTLVLRLPERQILALIGFLALLSALPLYNVNFSLWSNIGYAILSYLVGAWIALYLPGRRVSQPTLWAVAAATTLAMLGFNYLCTLDNRLVRAFHWNDRIHYGLVAAPVVVAACLFILALRLPQINGTRGLGRGLVLLAPATFGVYLLSENQAGFRLLWRTSEWLFPAPVSLGGKLGVFLVVNLVAYVALLGLAFLLDKAVNPLSRQLGGFVSARAGRLSARWMRESATPETALDPLPEKPAS